MGQRLIEGLMYVHIIYLDLSSGSCGQNKYEEFRKFVKLVSKRNKRSKVRRKEREPEREKLIRVLHEFIKKQMHESIKT